MSASKALLPHTTTEDFARLDIRVGRVLAAQQNAKANKPALVLEIDFGPLGIKISSAQIANTYTTETVVGKQVLAIVNFPAKNVAGIRSECLVLAALSDQLGTILVEPDVAVENGSRVA